ncbi:MAG: ABC transporter ATP-binding protein [Candidatus Lokiarchaeota archaeon]
MSKARKNYGDYEIWAHNLTKVYGRGHSAVNAVKGIELFMKPGIHGFLGPNGAGKTSTINMKKSYCHRRVQSLLLQFDLWDARDRKIKHYSGGMKQRIGLAMVLLHHPKLLILDEPTANLDPLGREKIINLIKQFSNHLSIFVSSHILSEIEQMCDTVTIINKGKIILSDTIQNVKDLFRGDLLIINTDINQKILGLIKNLKFIKKVWLAPQDNKIHLIVNNFEKAKKTLPKLVIDNEGVLHEFSQPELSLQEIFMKVIEQEENSNK